MKIKDEAVEVNEDALRALAQAYDREDAAQRGETDPWNLDDPGDIGDSDTWVSERLACARAAAEAFLSTLATEPAAPHELSGSAGELIDKMAEAIRGDTVCDDTPWGSLSEDRKIGWRGDAERALEVVKEYLTAPRSSSPSPKAVTIKDEMVDAAKRIRDTAMEQTMAARIPESGNFGAIAQDADWLVDNLTACQQEVVRLREERDEAQNRYSSAVMGEIETTRRATVAEARALELERALEELCSYSDEEYVPNVAFAKARAVARRAEQ